ncbi:hypothetical protein EAH89_28715 [Roseomonas nepalensis]|uniref:Transmembrane protein n=1 Tax=Muricoccus nepalensis TaxID=1854500 RepID=A0A502EY12_9PROT|nr:hypothetical protein [Roseomonas nepalensis]TPG41470.1 hypothetical protein EAH89_28715 [Roseomonas nepalensis]
MIIWRGWGILTIPIVALTGGLVVAILHNLMAGTGRYAGLALTAGLLTAAAVNWFVGRRLNRMPVRELLDPATGERVIVRRSHDLFFVPMQWWSLLLLAAALVSLFAIFFGASPVVKS